MDVRLPGTVLHDAFDLAVDGITLIAGSSFAKSTLLREAAAYCAFSVAAEHRFVELHAGTLADAPKLRLISTDWKPTASTRRITSVLGARTTERRSATSPSSRIHESQQQSHDEPAVRAVGACQMGACRSQAV